MITDPAEALSALLKPGCHWSARPRLANGSGGGLVTNVPLIPIVIAFALEENLHRALTNIEAGILLSSLVALVFWALIALVLRPWLAPHLCARMQAMSREG